MDRTLRRNQRSTVAVLSVVAGIVAAMVASGPVAAASAADVAPARGTARWLARQLAADGTLQNPLGGALPDHGLMIDTLFAMRAAGEAEPAEPIVRYLDGERHASDYFTWDGLVPGMGYDAVIVGGATAKVLVAAQVAGRDPRNFGGHDMVAETQGAIMRSGPDKGRVSDYSKNPDLADSVSNNANVFGQALGVIGLAGVGENDGLAIDKLVSQQCSEGYFRIFFSYIPTEETGDHVTPNGNKVSTCDEGKPFDQSGPDGDATGMALSALLAARHAGATGLDGPIDAAVSWLKAHQKAGGGWAAASARRRRTPTAPGSSCRRSPTRVAPTTRSNAAPLTWSPRRRRPRRTAVARSPTRSARSLTRRRSTRPRGPVESSGSTRGSGRAPRPRSGSPGSGSTT